MSTSRMASIENYSLGYVSWVDILLNIVVVHGKNNMILELMGDFIIENAENMYNTSLMLYASGCICSWMRFQNFHMVTLWIDEVERRDVIHAGDGIHMITMWVMVSM